MARIDYSSASAKINLALAEPPQFTCLPDVGDGVGPHHHGTMHIGPTLDYLERAYDDAKYGRPSSEPMLEMTMPTSVDATIAPPGKHILSMFVQYAPYKLAEGNWDDIKEAFADRCIEVLARYAPNVPARDRASAGAQPARPGAHVRPHRRQHHARRDGAAPALLLPARRRLGRPPHAGARAVSVRRRQPPRRRRDGRLRPERRDGDIEGSRSERHICWM